MTTSAIKITDEQVRNVLRHAGNGEGSQTIAIYCGILDAKGRPATRTVDKIIATSLVKFGKNDFDKRAF